MQLTSIVIAPKRSYSEPTPENPMRCVVKVASEDATVETVLSDDDMRRVLDLVVGIVGEAAKRNVDEFHAIATSIDATARGRLLEAGQ